MLRLTRLADYGIVLLIHVARESAGSVHAARQLSEDAGLPLPMVGKVLKTLARGGIVTSHRGVKGGYSLSRPAERITLAEIIETLEGPIAMTDCVASAPSDCEHEASCPSQGHWHVINDVVTAALTGVTLADMARGRETSPQLVQVEVGASGGIGPR